MATERIVDTHTTVQEMLAREVGSNGKLGYDFYRAAVEKLSPAIFRKYGLLGLLATEFNGDIPLALSNPCREASVKLPLRAQEPEVHVDWEERKAEIEESIENRKYFKGRELLFGHGGEPIRRETKRRKKLIFAYGKYPIKKDFGVVHKEEAQDTRRIIERYVLPGDTVCQFMGDRGVPSLALVFNRVGRNGLVYCASDVKHLEDRIVHDFFDLFISFPQIKGEEDETSRIEKIQGGTRIVNYQLLKDIQDFFVTPYFADLDLYLNGYQTENIRNLKSRFFLRYPLMPINLGVSPLFREIRSGSVDVFIEFDKLARFLELRKEELIWEIDRILKPGGIIIMKEGSQAQVDLEYYGGGLLDKYYIRERTPFRLKQPGRWIILRKLLPEKERVDGKHEFSLLLTKEDLAEEIYFVMRYERNDGFSKSSLTLSWFKKSGFLPVLMTEFDGNIDKAIEYAREKHITQTDGNEQEIDKIDRKKRFYTISDVAKELNTGKAVVRRALEKLGLKGQKSGRKKGNFTSGLEGIHLSEQEYLLVKESIGTKGSRND